jgi:hypothetical protein
MSEENNPKFVAKMKEAVGYISKARDIFSSGPLDYYLAKLVEHSDALLTKFSPLKVGDHAVISSYIECKNGWIGSEKTLAVGQYGEVVDVDYSNGIFWITFVPYNQWWRDRNGNYHPKERKNSFCLKASELTLVTKIKQGNVVNE